MNEGKEENKTEDEEERKTESEGEKSVENQKRWICLSRLMSVWLNTSEGEHAVV